MNFSIFAKLNALNLSFFAKINAREISLFQIHEIKKKVPAKVSTNKVLKTARAAGECNLRT